MFTMFRIRCGLAQTWALCCWQSPGVGRETLLSSLLVIAVVFSVAPPAAVLLAQVLVSRGYPASFWVSGFDWMLRPAVVDVSGALLGMLPAPGASVPDARQAPAPDAIPEACIDLVLASEDAHHASWRQVRGVDAWDFFPALLAGRGASTLPMQLARQTAEGWGGKDIWSIARRKFLEVGAAGLLLDLHQGSHRQLAARYLSIAPFGVAHGDIRGIAAAADVYFGLPASRLGREHCAVLMAFLPERPKLAAQPAERQALWLRRRAVAARLLSKTYGLSAQQAQASLARWPTLPQRKHIPGHPDAVTLNLVARTQALVLPHLARIRTDMAGERQASARPAQSAAGVLQ